MVQTWIQTIALLGCEVLPLSLDCLLTPHYLGLGVGKGFYSRFTD